MKKIFLSFILLLFALQIDAQVTRTYTVKLAQVDGEIADSVVNEVLNYINTNYKDSTDFQLDLSSTYNGKHFLVIYVMHDDETQNHYSTNLRYKYIGYNGVEVKEEKAFLLREDKDKKGKYNVFQTIPIDNDVFKEIVKTEYKR